MGEFTKLFIKEAFMNLEGIKKVLVGNKSFLLIFENDSDEISNLEENFLVNGYLNNTTKNIEVTINERHAATLMWEWGKNEKELGLLDEYKVARKNWIDLDKKVEEIVKKHLKTDNVTVSDDGIWVRIEEMEIEEETLKNLKKDLGIEEISIKFNKSTISNVIGMRPTPVWDMIIDERT